MYNALQYVFDTSLKDCILKTKCSEFEIKLAWCKVDDGIKHTQQMLFQNYIHMHV